MTTIKPVLNNRPNKDGRRTLILQIIHNRRRGVVFSSYHLSTEEFDTAKGLAIAPCRSRAARKRTQEINGFIATQIIELQRVIDKLKQQGIPFSPTDITAGYRQHGDKRFMQAFVLAQYKELEHEGRHGTANTYKATLAVFEKFAGKMCRLDELDTAQLSKFEHYLKQIPVKRNTITFYMRVLRALYNKAKKEQLVKNSGNPFENISFRMDKTRKLALAPETLRCVAVADFGCSQEQAEARDLFMFSFYARGMSFVDMAFLTHKSIHDGILRYTRHKTGQLFTVRITLPLQEIIDRYAHCSPWVLPIMRSSTMKWNNSLEQDNITEHTHRSLQHKRYKLALSRCLYQLSDISKQLTTEKKLTFNAARHSWASLARNRGIPVAVISHGLGHTSEKTTTIYLEELDNREIDRANEIICKL